jgi:hypothetical protein
MQFFHSIWLGIERRPLSFFGKILLTYSSLWTVIESVSNFFPDVKLQGAIYYLALVAISISIASALAYQRRLIKFRVGNSNTTIKVYFGDLFEQSGHLAIPVNEYFDSELGLPVSPKSLHGMVIDRFFGGHPASFDQLVTSDLASTPAQTISRSTGKTYKYEIGTTASIKTSSHRFLLFALCITDISTCKASATLPDLVRAIEGLCAKSRIILGGDKLVVPLVGSGLSGIGISPLHLLQVILLVLVNETKKNQFALEVDVVLHPSRFDEIDLSVIEDLWR